MKTLYRNCFFLRIGRELFRFCTISNNYYYFQNVQPGSIMVEYLHIIGVMGDTKEKVNNTINSYFEKQMNLQFCYRFIILKDLLYEHDIIIETNAIIKITTVITITTLITITTIIKITTFLNSTAVIEITVVT